MIQSIINDPAKKLKSAKFKRKFGTLTEEYKSDTILSRNFMAVILARKYCFVLAIIATYRFPLIQIFLLTIINSLKAYFSFKRPFKENNRKEIISEVILAVSSFTFIIFLFDETFTEEQMFSLG